MVLELLIFRQDFIINLFQFLSAIMIFELASRQRQLANFFTVNELMRTIILNVAILMSPQEFDLALRIIYARADSLWTIILSVVDNAPLWHF